MMWASGSYSGWLWLYGLVSVGALVVLIVWTVRVLRNSQGPSPVDPQPSAARLLLDGQLARGEITAEQHRERVRALGEQP